MRYDVIAIGKIKRGFYRAGCDHYVKRLRHHAKADVLELREGRGATAEDTRTVEGDRILERAGGFLVAMDERGDRVRSTEMAERIEALALRGTSHVTFAIGGADGLSAGVRTRADALWRLSDLTLPHELARLILLEQLYRAETIRAGHPYHREG